MGDFRSNPFSKPKGILGKLAGFLMTYGNGNRFRCEWSLQVMQIRPMDIILEIGFGTGTVIQEISKNVTTGLIYGIDESDCMVKFAVKRNQGDVQTNKVILYHTSVNNLPVFEKKIDKVFSINSYEFWEDKVNALCKIKEQISKNGEIFIIHQILNSKGEPPINELCDMYSEDLLLSGFSDVVVKTNSTPEILCVKATSK